MQSVKVGESIISLLLKLHSQLSGVPDSYNPEQTTISDNEASSSSSSSTSDSSSSSFTSLLPNESRIGDGPFFISQLLRKISDLDPMCKQTIIETRNKLWPRMQECEEDEQRERENREREERRRRAKERQQKLMAEFANKQKQFMEKAMKTGKLYILCVCVCTYVCISYYKFTSKGCNICNILLYNRDFIMNLKLIWWFLIYTQSIIYINKIIFFLFLQKKQVHPEWTGIRRRTRLNWLVKRSTTV